MENSGTLSPDYKEDLLKGVKKYYLILKIFGTLFFGMTCMGIIGFFNDYITNPAYREGLFSVPIFRTILIVASIIMFSLIGLGTGFMMYAGFAKEIQVKKDDYTWDYARITDIRQVRRNGKTKYIIYADGKRCNVLGFTLQDVEKIRIGNEVLLFSIGSKSLVEFIMFER